MHHYDSSISRKYFKSFILILCVGQVVVLKVDHLLILFSSQCPNLSIFFFGLSLMLCNSDSLHLMDFNLSVFSTQGVWTDYEYHLIIWSFLVVSFKTFFQGIISFWTDSMNHGISLMTNSHDLCSVSSGYTHPLEYTNPNQLIFCISSSILFPLPL